MKGRVLTVDEVRRFGTIQPDEGTEADLFFDGSDLRGAAFVSVGDRVEFQVKRSPRGLNAINVVILTSPVVPAKPKPVRSIRFFGDSDE